MKLEILSDYGIDFNKGMARCLNDAALYEALLGLFLQDDTLARAQAALDAADYTALFKCMHELKGACGSADLTALYDAVCPLVELLRASNRDNADAAAVQDLFARVEAAYYRAREGISLSLGV